jgi:hypothetical protein
MNQNYRYYLLLIYLFLSSSVLSQYEGLDSGRRQAVTPTVEAPFVEDIKTYRYKDLEYSGLDFTLFGGGVTNAIELAPFTGLQYDNKIYGAIGISGSVLLITQVNNTIFTTAGSLFSFVRVPISSLFIHLEYRIQNGITSYSSNQREWYGVPILAGGYNNDGRLGMYALVGVAFNNKFAYTNPLGPFVYRFGFRF